MPPQIKLFLTDPEGVVTVAKEIKDALDEFDAPNAEGDWFPRRKFSRYIYTDKNGILATAYLKDEVNLSGGPLLGTATWRPAKKELAIRGYLLADIYDELHEALALVGIRAVLIQQKPAD